PRGASTTLYAARRPHTSTLLPYTTLFRSMLAKRLAIGRPDLPRQFDDGGLIDLNHAPEHVLTSLPGVSAIRPPSSNWRGRSGRPDRKSTRLNSSHVKISYGVFCLKKKKTP